MEPHYTASAKRVEPALSKKQVLVVDDERHVTLILKRGLERLSGLEIATASSGPEALKLLDQEHFDLLITDYSMPGMTGLDLARGAKDRDPEMIIVFVTAFNTPDLQNEAGRLGIARILNKPMRLGEIREIVSDLLDLGSSS
jgi:CheY-like chemotaxis protein